MKRAGIYMRRIGMALVCLCPFAEARSASPSDGNAPATVQNRQSEEKLAIVRLTPDAEERLGIASTAVKWASMPKSLRLPGEAFLPPGRAITLSAPVSGRLLAAPSTTGVPAAGRLVRQGDVCFELLPGETKEGVPFSASDRVSLARTKADLAVARVEAERLLADATARVRVAELALNRASQLQQEGAGPRRTVDEAQAELATSQSALRAAQERTDALSQVAGWLAPEQKTSVAIEAPFEGVVRALHAVPGQLVASGAPLLEIAAYDPMWIRVPVFAGELYDVSSGAPVEVRRLSATSASPGQEGIAVEMPGSADLQTATVDLYYQVSNPDRELRPGERVAVRLPTTARAEQLVIPYSALLFDASGGTWVYERIGAQEYARRRVLIGDVVGTSAVVDRGLEEGWIVVIAGAAELFGAEFGIGK